MTTKHMRPFTPVEWLYLLAIMAVLTFSLTGCSQASVDRAQAGVDQAKEILAKAEAAEARVAEAVATAREIAAAIGDERAKELVAKADAALAMAKSGTEAAKIVVATADTGLAAAKASQAAGGSTFDMLLAAAGALIPGAGAAALAIRNAIKSGRALRQTVAGVEEARKVLGESDWECKVAPALAAAQDESVKALITKIQAK